MQLHPETEPHIAAASVAHDEEVRLLRERVALLEEALDAATARLAESSLPAGIEPVQEPTPETEFGGPLEVVPDQGFAAAWNETDESSFEERIAQKAFFQVGSVDEASREWLLAN